MARTTIPTRWATRFMKAIVLAVAAMGVARCVEAGELPACDDPHVKVVLARAIRADAYVNEPRDLNSTNPDMRWCAVQDIVLPYPGLSGSFADVVFTIEWINEPEGEYWVQVKSRRRSVGPNVRGLQK